MSQMKPELQARPKQPVFDESVRSGPVFRPDVDVAESPEEFVVTADLPGVDHDRVHVGLHDGVLTIDATVSAALPDPSWSLVYGEYQTGSFHRRFHLSEGIDVERIRAQMRDGVLTLHLPKTERHRTRRIEVTG